MIKTNRTNIRILTENDAEMICQFYIDNRVFLSPWEPSRSETFFTIDYWAKAGQESEAAFDNANQFRFIAISQEDAQIIGFCNFSNIVHGAFQACHLGYGISEKNNNQGYMTEIIQATTDYIFDQVGLHRVMANYMPRNEASRRVLEKLDFEREGYAKQYLKIADKWEDHILTSKINPFSK